MPAAGLSSNTRPGFRIRTLLLALGLIVLIPLLALLVFDLNKEEQRIRHHAESTAMSLAQIAAHTLERQLGDTQQFLTTLAARANVRALDVQRCDPVFGDFQKSHPGFTALTTTTVDGELICSSRSNKDARASKPPQLEIALMPPLALDETGSTPRFRVGRAQKGLISGRWVLPVSQPLFDDQGNVTGSIAAWIDLLRLTPLNESILSKLPKDTLSTVFDDNADVLSRSHAPEKWVGVNRTGFPQATKALEQRGGFFQLVANIDHIERLFAVVPVEGTRWVVSVGMATAPMFEALTQQRQQWMMAIGALICFSALIIWLLTRHILQPFQALSDVASAVRKGNLQRRIANHQVGNITEITRVASQFNIMLDTLETEKQRLEQSEAGFRSLFTEMRSGFALHEIICDAAGTPVDYRFLSVNPAFEEMTGLSASTLIGKRALEILPNLEPTWIAQYGRVALTGEPAAFEDYNIDLKKYFDVRAFRPQPGQFGVMVLDITERRQAEIALAQEKSLLRRVIDTIPDLIFFKDADGHYLGCNEAFEGFAGRNEQAQIGKTDFDFFDKKTALFFREQDRQMLDSGETHQNEEWVTYPDGRQVLLNTIKTPFANAQGEALGILGISRDITAQSQAQDKLHQLAFFDPLTKLPNRRLLLDRLQRAVAASARRDSCGAVIYIDLDNFKVLNEAYGRELGDQLLIEVAHRLQRCVRDEDSVARQGGDEFIILLEDLGSEMHEAAAHAEVVTEKILRAIRQPYQLGQLEHHCAASIGVSIYHDHDESAEEILKRTETAMYRAKEAGRDLVRFFDPAMQAALEHRMSLETDLRRALPGNELRLYYQAQVDSKGAMLGAEALIRWEHPQRGLVSPVQFIPLAEESGLILPIGTWVLETACAQLKDWELLPAARHLTLSVNVSVRQFRQTDFVATTRSIVEQSGIDPSRLKLELTESIVIDNVTDTIEKMIELKALGLSFSMDDFGTGYSSLTYLKRLPIDQLKIDQSFVRDISTDYNDAAIVETIIKMGHTMGMKVIAEGVETTEQRDFLMQRGCLNYQGYLYSRPVPLADFEQLLKLPEPETDDASQGNLLI